MRDGQPSGSARPARVALVCMPWASVAQPSLSLGLIKAQLAQGGIAADVHYLNVVLAKVIGLDVYESTKNKNVMASEWVFAERLAARDLPAESYTDYLARRGTPASERKLWAQIRGQAAEYIEYCLEAVDWAHYDVVGFTTSMMQTAASLAMAQALKERHPHLVIVLGGANCEGSMGEGLHSLFTFVDVVVRGEADAIVTTLFARLLAKEPLDDIPGLCIRRDGRTVTTGPARMVMNIERNPTPDYWDYFGQADGVDGLADRRTLLMFESSRGCWWGARSHCKFCALNGTGMTFRSKSVARIIAELTELRDRHEIATFVAADNILDDKIVTDLSNSLERDLPGVRIFYDVRATLTRPEMQAMARGGINELEAGLESLSTPILKSMGKGATGIGNVRFLRRCREFGIVPLWNYLFAFPSESYREYEAAAARIDPWLHHLPPADVAFPLSLQRFAPYYENAAQNGIRVRGPVEDYRHIYGMPNEQLDKIAYYYAFDYLDGYDPARTGALISRVIADWQRAYADGATLSVDLIPDGMIVHDRRGGRALSRRYGAAEALLYRLCESPQREADLPHLLRQAAPVLYLRSVRQIPAMLVDLKSAGLFYEERGRLLAIAVPTASDFWIDSRADAKSCERVAAAPA